MEYRTVENCGEVGIEFCNIDIDGARVSKEFLKRLMNNIILRSIAYYDKTEEPVFYYGERQFYSVVCPSIADITRRYLMELPLKRGHVRKKKYKGRGDYWVSYRDYSLLIELKHCYFGCRGVDNPSRMRVKSIADTFNDAIKKLEKIPKDECRYITKSAHDKGLIKIALQVIVFYE